MILCKYKVTIVTNKVLKYVNFVMFTSGKFVSFGK